MNLSNSARLLRTKFGRIRSDLFAALDIRWESIGTQIVGDGIGKLENYSKASTDLVRAGRSNSNYLRHERVCTRNFSLCAKFAVHFVRTLKPTHRKLHVQHLSLMSDSRSAVVPSHRTPIVHDDLAILHDHQDHDSLKRGSILMRSLSCGTKVIPLWTYGSVRVYRNSLLLWIRWR